MNFYRISTLESSPIKYAWADSYGPIGAMPFLDSFSDPIKSSFLESWDLDNDVPGIHIDEGGSEWSDFLGCGGGPPSYFVSNRVVEDLRLSEIPIFRCTEIPIGKICSSRLRGITPPKYYVLEAEPGFEIRSLSIPIEEQIAARNSCPPILIGPYRTIGKLESWNGSDIFSSSHGRSLTALFCTDKVKDLAATKGWSNIKFMPIEIE